MILLNIFSGNTFEDNQMYQPDISLVDLHKEAGLYLENDEIKATGIGLGFGMFQITIPNQCILF